jgi:REP element-mobilizing transposase RayT
MAAMAKRKAKQLELHLPTHGGRRDGAGCKPSGPRPRVAHSPRPPFHADHPVRITIRICAGLPSLRDLMAWRTIVEIFRELRSEPGFRIVHYSILINHLHLIVEHDGEEAFRISMQKLTIRLALRLNRAWRRRGRVIEHRYHDRQLCSPREVRNSILYVLCNSRKHAAEQRTRFAADWIDPQSSGRVFDGWHGRSAAPSTRDYGTSAPQTWLLAVGWRRHGLIPLDAIPGRDALDSAEVVEAMAG